MSGPSFRQPGAPGSSANPFLKLTTVILLLGAALVLVAAPSFTATHTGIYSPSACFPPQGAGGAGYLGRHIYCEVYPWCLMGSPYPVAGLMNNFSGCWALPGPGATQDYAFRTKFAVSTPCDVGSSITTGHIEVSQPDMDVLVRLQYDHADGNMTYYNAELLSMEFAPTFPMAFPHSVLRESPTLASTGQYVVEELGPNSYLISSFLDIYLECNPPYGSGWGPVSGPWHVTLLEPVTPVRTSTWGQLKRIYR